MLQLQTLCVKNETEFTHVDIDAESIITLSLVKEALAKDQMFGGPLCMLKTPHQL